MYLVWALAYIVGGGIMMYVWAGSPRQKMNHEFAMQSALWPLMLALLGMAAIADLIHKLRRSPQDDPEGSRG